MIEAVKIITLEGTNGDKDFHDAPRISRLLYFTFSALQRSSHSLLFCKCVDCQQNRLQI